MLLTQCQRGIYTTLVIFAPLVCGGLGLNCNILLSNFCPSFINGGKTAAQKTQLAVQCNPVKLSRYQTFKLRYNKKKTYNRCLF